jgi:hypothetical protein
LSSSARTGVLKVESRIKSRKRQVEIVGRRRARMALRSFNFETSRRGAARFQV